MRAPKAKPRTEKTFTGANVFLRGSGNGSCLTSSRARTYLVLCSALFLLVSPGPSRGQGGVIADEGGRKEHVLCAQRARRGARQRAQGGRRKGAAAAKAHRAVTTVRSPLNCPLHWSAASPSAIAHHSSQCCSSRALLAAYGHHIHAIRKLSIDS